MSKNSAVVSVGLRIDSSEIDRLYVKLASQFSNIGNNAEISDGLKNQFKQILDNVDELSEKVRGLGKSKLNSDTFTGFKSGIFEQINLLDQRTTVLETTMKGLINTLSTDAGSAMANSLKELMKTMNQTTSIARGMVTTIDSVQSVVGKKDIVNIVDEGALSQQLNALKKLQETVSKIRDEDVDPLEIDFKDKNDAIDEYKKSVNDFINSVKKLNNMKASDLGYDKALQEAVELGEKMSGISSAITESFDYKQIGRSLENAFGSADKYIDELVGIVRGRVKSVETELNAIKAEPKAEAQKDKSGKTTGYTIPIEVSTSAKVLAAKVSSIIKTVQNSVDKEAIQIELQLITPSQTKKANAALKKFQEQVNGISDDTTREEMQKIVNEIKKGFGREITANLKTSFDDVATSIRTTINGIKDELKKNPIKIHPDIEFAEEDIKKLREQVEEVTKTLTEALQDAAKEGLFKEEETGEGKKKKKNDVFTDVEDRVKKVIGQLKSIPKTFDDSFVQVFENSDQKLEELIQDLPKLDGFNMGQEAAGNLAKNLGDARDILKELLQLRAGGDSLGHLGKEWKLSDEDMISMYDKDHIRERSAIYTKSGKIYGAYSYGERNSTRNMYAAIKRLVSDGEIPYIGIHTHPDANIPSMSYRDKGDLAAFAAQLEDGILKQATVAAESNLVQVFDAERFYSDYKNIDFTSPESSKKITEAEKELTSRLKIGRTTGAFFVDLLNERGKGFDYTLDELFQTVFGSYTDKIKPFFSEIKERIKSNFDSINAGDSIKFPVMGPIIDVLETLGLDDENYIEAVSEFFTPRKLMEAAGIGHYSSNDIYQFQHGKIMPQVLEKAFGSKKFKASDFINGNYIEELSFEEFSKKYGIGSDKLSGLFANTGIEEFTEQLKSIGPMLQQLSDIIVDFSKFSDGSKFTLGIDDASEVAQNISKITQALSEFVDIYKQLNMAGEPSVNISKLADALKDLYGTGLLKKDRGYDALSSLFGVDTSKDYNNAAVLDQTLRRLRPEEIVDNDSFYQQWASNIAENAEKAGIALDKFKVKQKETSAEIQNVNLNIDTNEFEKLVKNTTTLKNSLNTLRKELKDLNISTDLTSITTPLESLQTTLLEFSEVVQKSTGILSKSNLEKEFEKIKEAANKLDGVKFNTKAGKEGATSIITAYKDYLSKGGENTLEDIGGSENLQKYLAKHINDGFKEGAEGVEKESSSLKELAATAGLAAVAKKEVAEANAKLLSSIIQSVSGLDNEGNAFKNLTQMFNSLGGDKSAEKMLRVREALNGIVNILNTDVGESSFIKSLENLALTGDALKDLATVIKATKTQIDNAKKGVGSSGKLPNFDYAQEKINTQSEELNDEARKYFSNFGLVLESTIRKTQDGQIELSALVKTAENQIKEFVATSADGKHFNINKEETNSARGLKKILAYEKLRRAWERMNANASNDHVTDEIMFDRDTDTDIWDTIKEVYEQYKTYVGNLQKVTRQVREGANGELLESFSFIGDQGHITMGREGDVVASSQSIDDLQGLVDVFNQLYKAASNYYELRLKFLSGDATSYEIQQLQEAEKIYNELSQKAQQMSAQFGDNIVTDAMTQYQDNIGKNFDKYLEKQIDSFDSKIQKIEQTRTNQRNQYLPGFQEEIDKAKAAVIELNNLRESHPPGTDWNEEDLEKVNSALKQIDATYAGLNDKRNIAAKTEDVDILIQRASREINENSLTPDLRGRFEDVINYLKSVRTGGVDAADGLAAIDQVTLGKIKGELKGLSSEVDSTGQRGKGFLKQFAGAIKSQSAQFLATYFSLQDFIRYGREMVQTVTQLDSNMIELKKVSGETDKRLEQSFKNSTTTAREYGATISDIIQSTADWSRAGYEIDEAEQLAAVTQLYQNVGDNLSQETASEYLISTMRGFQIDSSEATSIVDKINEVANNFSIDTAGIGEALERSAASFYASGTSLDKSIALVTATSEITQDPASAGTMWKTNKCLNVQKCA